MKATWIKVNGTWKQIKNAWTKTDGVWKQKVIPKGKISGTWKELMSYGRHNVYYSNTLDREAYKLFFKYRLVDPKYNMTEKVLTINLKNPTDFLVSLMGITYVNPSEGTVALCININREENKTNVIVIVDLVKGIVLRQWETQRMLGTGIRSMKSNGNIITLIYETFEKYTNLKVFDLNLNVIKDVLLDRSDKLHFHILRKDGGIYTMTNYQEISYLTYWGSDYQIKKQITLPTATASLLGIDKDENIYISRLYRDLYKYSPELELLSSNTNPTENTDRFIDHEGKIVEESWSRTQLTRKNFDGSLLWQIATSSKGVSFSIDTNGNYIRYEGKEVVFYQTGKIQAMGEGLTSSAVQPLSIQGNFI